jgi:hypothetical protein
MPPNELCVALLSGVAVASVPSEAGSRFVERIQTAAITLRQQKWEVLDFLTQACRAAISGTDPPSLLPAAQPFLLNHGRIPSERFRVFWVMLILPSQSHHCPNLGM